MIPEEKDGDVKVCETCDVEKPVTEFPVMKSGGSRGNGKRYRYKICRPCQNAASAAARTPVPPMPTAEEMHDWYTRGCPI